MISPTTANNWWETTPIEQMSEQQWEDLCDGCGRCCMIKTWKGYEVKTCKVACKLLNINTAKCQDYNNRQQRVSNCVKITPEIIDTPGLLPTTCAYKLIKDKQPLYPWHHLISGSRETVKEAGISIIGWAEVNEDKINIFQLGQYVEQALD